PPVALRITVFQIQQYQIQSLPKAGKIFRPFFPVNNSGGIQAGVNPSLFGLFHQFCQKIQLKKRLASRGGDSPCSVKLPVFLVLIENFPGRHLSTTIDSPGIRIVAVSAPQGTSLKKYHKTNSGTVYGPETLQGMNPSLFLTHPTSPHGRFWKSPHPAALLSGCENSRRIRTPAR